MEEVLVPLGFFAMVFGFPLLRREMIHRHTLEKMRAGQAQPQSTDLAAQKDDAASLALRLPEPHRLYALALLCRLQDADMAALDARTAFTLRQARLDYLPATLSAYLNLSAQARETLKEQGVSPETHLQEQLQLISQGVNNALAGDTTAQNRVLTQGAFLREVFPVSVEQRQH